jgi:SAM-dependent methyltransferase
MPLSSWARWFDGPRRPSDPQPGAGVVSIAARVDAAYWLVLARAPSAAERRERQRAEEQDEAFEQLLGALVASTEFRLLYEAYELGTPTGRRPLDVEQGLRSLGPDDVLIDLAYRAVLGRAADADGLSYYRGRLANGPERWPVVQGLVLSDEFRARLRAICPHVGTIPRDIQLCELANPAKWDNPEWMALLASLGTVPPDRMSMHRKGYEYTQTLFGLQRLGRLDADARVLSVGAGHEPVLYWLANRVGRVVATDMYGDWRDALAGEGDRTVLRRPEEYAPFPYRRDRLSFLEMDGRALAFARGSFDIAYSLSSIEHFGGLEGAIAAVDEMARVLVPGGMLVLATEYIVEGPPVDEAFTPDDVHALVSRPGLRLIQPIDERVYARYDITPVDIERNPYQTPHMAVRIGDTVFTSVIAFLERS